MVGKHSNVIILRNSTWLVFLFFKSMYSNLRKSLKHKFMAPSSVAVFPWYFPIILRSFNDGFISFSFEREETCQGPFSAMPDWGAVAKKLENRNLMKKVAGWLIHVGDGRILRKLQFHNFTSVLYKSRVYKSNRDDYIWCIYLILNQFINLYFCDCVNHNHTQV